MRKKRESKEMNLIDLLKAKADPEVKGLLEEFHHAPWDYRVFFPMSLEDGAIGKIYLQIGKTKKRYEVILEYDMVHGTVTLVQNEFTK